MLGLDIKEALAGIDPVEQSRLFKLTVSFAAKKLAENPDFIAALAEEMNKQNRSVAAAVSTDGE